MCFADDTALTMLVTSIASNLASLFDEFHLISALGLNIRKTIFIPLWTLDINASHIRSIIQENYPFCKDVPIDSKGKYLGYVIGPGASHSSWTRLLEKFLERGRW